MCSSCNLSRKKPYHPTFYLHRTPTVLELELSPRIRIKDFGASKNGIKKQNVLAPRVSSMVHHPSIRREVWKGEQEREHAGTEEVGAPRSSAIVINIGARCIIRSVGLGRFDL